MSDIQLIPGLDGGSKLQVKFVIEVCLNPLIRKMLKSTKVTNRYISLLQSSVNTSRIVRTCPLMARR